MRQLKRYIKKAENMPPKLFIRKSIGVIIKVHLESSIMQNFFLFAYAYIEETGIIN